jgi:hypothetical protein
VGGFVRHHLGDEAVERGDPGLGFAAAEHLGAGHPINTPQGSASLRSRLDTPSSTVLPRLIACRCTSTFETPAK